MSDFDWTATAERVETDGEEIETITRAQAGDASALARLFLAYLPTLCARVATHCRAGMPVDDARQTAVLALVSAVRAFDGTRAGRLAPVLCDHLARELSAASGAGHGFAVPTRSLERYFSILSAADGDHGRAVVLARDYGMARDTFETIRAAVHAAHPAGIDGGAGEAGAVVVIETARPLAAIEDRDMVRQAFRAVNDLERRVCRIAYGFEDFGDPQVDAEVGHRVGVGRVTALRTRTRALSKMRAALGTSGSQTDIGIS